jgi:hypothetical protein
MKQILKWISKKLGGSVLLDSFGTGQGKLTGSCKNDSKAVSPIRYGTD